MRALGLVCGVVLAWLGETAAWAQPVGSPADNQVASCPTILPVAAGERSVIVPTIAPQFAQHTASLPPATAWDGAHSLLRQKLAERDRLQREITELRNSTKTPEQVLVRVKVVEIDRTKLDQAGVDLKLMGDSSVPIDLVPILRGEKNFGFATVANSTLAGVFEMLEKQQFAKMIATPTVVVVSGTPASLHVGGEIPVPPAEQGGAVTSKEYGTRLDVTATTLGDSKVRLAIHPRVAEVDETQGIVVGGQKIPAITLREVDSVCELKLGESFLISGLVQERRTAQPGWAIRKSEAVHEIALVVVATPELVR